MNQWLTRLLILVLFVSLAAAFPPAAIAAASLALFVALIWWLRAADRLPRGLMDILDRLSNRAALERRMAERERDSHVIDAEELARRLKAKIVGQDAVADAVAQQMRRRLAARRRGKPVAVFCFAGPPGVGKTYFAKTLAEALYGDSARLRFIDMSQMGQPHSAATLFGQAKGYVGSDSYGLLTAGLRDAPECVVLLDEFEKAHPEVHRRFLSAWNDGFITESSDGAKVSTEDAVFVLTTNAASRRIGEIAKQYAEQPEQLRALAKRALQEDGGFAPEVLSRIDAVFVFTPLEGLDIARVVALELEALARQYDFEIVDGGIDPDILLNATERARDLSSGGVRDLTRLIESDVSDSLLDLRAAGCVGAIRLSVRESDGVVEAHAVDPPESADAPSPDSSLASAKAAPSVE